MLLDEIFAGYTFSASTIASDTRLLSDINLSSLVQVEVGRGSALSAPYSMLGFNLAVSGNTQNTIDLKINFENPLSVSTGDKPDKLFLKIVDPGIFISQDGQTLDMEGEDEKKIDLPKQFPAKGLFNSISDAGKSVTVVTNAAMGVNVVLTIVLSVSL